ncbi:hypothetical protein EDB83DRAFT_2411350 [Lactarius deliciosus]|nr:hypothetical protein EDB83DRAFT_2411350 [Lactarius deliciosus]
MSWCLLIPLLIPVSFYCVAGGRKTSATISNGIKLYQERKSRNGCYRLQKHVVERDWNPPMGGRMLEILETL